jgi:CHAD domain-containing protein
MTDTAPSPSPAVDRFSHALREFTERRIGQIAVCHRFDQADDPVETIHELRVASRRLRALGDAFAPVLRKKERRAVERELAAVTRAASRLREWDVHAGNLARRAERANEPERAALQYALAQVDGRRERERARTKKRLRDLDLERLTAALGVAVAGAVTAAERLGAPELVLTALGPRTAAVVEAAAHAAEGDDDALHELRIQSKRLRYVLELVEPAAPGLRALRRAVTELQDVLGEHHDRAVLIALLEGLRVKLEDRGRLGRADAMTQVIEGLVAERDALRAQALAALDTLDVATLPARFQAVAERNEGLTLAH